jgi:hypothetical protein
MKLRFIILFGLIQKESKRSRPNKNLLKISSQIGGSKLASLSLAQTGYSRLFDLLCKFSIRKFLMV